MVGLRCVTVKGYLAQKVNTSNEAQIRYTVKKPKPKSWEEIRIEN